MADQLTGAEYRKLMGLDKEKGPKPLKYRNKITTVTTETGETLRFDSKAEARYYGYLKLLEGRGEVMGFERQVKYPLTVNGQLVCTYIADFVVEYVDGRVETVDVKGVATDVYRIKAKLMKACHGIDVKLVK